MLVLMGKETLDQNMMLSSYETDSDGPSFFKFENPLTFGPQVQAIKMIDVGKGAEANENITFIALQRESSKDVPAAVQKCSNRRMHVTNTMIESVEECNRYA
ncbi:hypothetical protein QAD02_018336 [Eretmocerus hayati]|uniref:Uncharacterized protein n=1 Tax=Eretmocerus hayati TaxID=131215 RepID=A0ACC2PGW0_9HYME|nr:hypothetical protein QAD02_018336 [Eretmocerus hayati]